MLVDSDYIYFFILIFVFNILLDDSVTLNILLYKTICFEYFD